MRTESPSLPRGARGRLSRSRAVRGEKEAMQLQPSSRRARALAPT